MMSATLTTTRQPLPDIRELQEGHMSTQTKWPPLTVTGDINRRTSCAPDVARKMQHIQVEP